MVVTVLCATLQTHVVFFGASRYGLVTFPLIGDGGGVRGGGHLRSTHSRESTRAR